MQITEKVIVVTGGGNGIGRALCRRFKAEGAKAVVVADMNAATAKQVADEIGGTAVTCDVSREADVVALVKAAIAQHGGIDLFCSNAGIAVNGDEHTPDAEWARCWDVNVMAHVYAARAVIPAHARTRRRLSAADRLGRRTADASAVGDLRGHQARVAGLRRMAVDDLRRSRHRRLRAVSAGREDRHAAPRRGRSARAARSCSTRRSSRSRWPTMW